MKKLTTVLLTTLLMTGGTLMAAPASTSGNPSNPAETAQVKTLLSRLDEIKSLDKSGMSSVEKKNLRMEVRSIKKELKTLGNGVYLSVGAAILIIILLILLL